MKILETTRPENSSLTDGVYTELRSAILTGKISGGSRLVESALAARMKVSRTPVREALQKLALEGLLYSIPRAGYIVAEMSDYDIQDLFDTRTAIERIAAAAALEKITPEELAQLDTNLGMMEELMQTGQSTQSMTELDTEFHNIIYKAGRSKTMFGICKGLSDHTLKYRIPLINLPESVVKTRDGHRRIYTALCNKAAGELDEAVRCHLQLAKEDIIKQLTRMRQEAIL